MSAIEPEEMRYAAISTFGLIVFTAILKWSGVGQTRFTPMKPNTVNATSLDSRSAFETFMDPSITTSSPFAKLIDAVLTPLQIVIDLLVTWANVWDAMGFGAIFIIVPMFIMLTIIAGVAVKLANTALP